MSSNLELASSLTSPENTVFYVDGDVSHLTFRPHSLNNLNWNYDDNDTESVELDAESFHKRDLDEMMVQFSGRSVHTIRMKNKHISESFKILSLCEVEYTYTFLPTSRISPSDVKKIDHLSQTGCLILHLVKQLLGIGIDACETVRKNSSEFPKELKVDKNIKLDWNIRS
ncbi:2179_t:CDS:2, partial [Ambispora gerdemannii]